MYRKCLFFILLALRCFQLVTDVRFFYSHSPDLDPEKVVWCA
jgi:hypothetical protein